jgi:pimeloyl-ACP methyl ester carboxylesterase
MGSVIAAAALLITFRAGLDAQEAAPRQDPALNNLVHAAGYETVRLGVLDEVVRRGSGPVDIVIIPGWGFGADDFAQFMQDNASRYHMTAVTLPGFGRTRAPPMPAAGTSYAEATWTRAAEAAIARLIEGDRLHKPIIVGHFMVGTQIAVRLAIDHPDLVGGVVIVGGEPTRYQPSRWDSTGNTPMPLEERVHGVDSMLAPRWFKTVTRQTWNAGNFKPFVYSRDSTRAARLWMESSNVPMPVMIRYLCEYLAMDLSDDFPRLEVPVRVLAPGFTPTFLADRRNAGTKRLYVGEWERIGRGNPRITVRVVPDSRVFVTDDQPAAVRAAIDEIARSGRER